MKQTDNIQKFALQDFSALSFVSGANQSLQIQECQTQQPESKHGYCFIVSFVTFGFYFLTFAIIQLSTNFNELSYKFELNRFGNSYLSKNHFISFSENTQIFLYLEMQKITQFDISLNNPVQDKEKCHQFKTNQQMGKYLSFSNVTLNPLSRAIPCGKYASFYPEGSLQIFQTGTNQSLTIFAQKIGTGSDQIQNFNASSQWANLQSQRFLSWIRADTSMQVKKYWGKISQVVSGNYQMNLSVNNQMPKVQKLHVSLHNSGALGGYNTQLCYVNFFYAVFVFLAALTSFMVQKKWGHKKLLAKKNATIGHSNQIKIFLNSNTSTPAVKFQ